MSRLKRKPGLPDVRPQLPAHADIDGHRVPSGQVAHRRRVRGKQLRPTKQLVAIRLDREVVAAFRNTGRGWQARINATLIRAAKRLSPAASS